MTTDPVTFTLPFLTWQGLTVILVAVGVFIAVALVWVMLNGTEREKPPALESWFKALAWALLPVWLLLLAGTLWGLWLVFNGQPSPLSDTSFGLGALIAAFLGAPFVIYGTYLRHKTQRLEQEGHMTDRINKAVEQLGADKIVKRDGKEESVPNIEVRMGAILSLERIAQDSTMHDKGRDHVRVMEILCAYIRENSNARKPVDFPLAEWAPLKDGASEEERAAHLEWRKVRFPETSNPLAWQWARTLREPRADVQLALVVLGRRNRNQLCVEAAWPTSPDKATTWPFDLKFKHVIVASNNQPLREAQAADYNRELVRWKANIDSYSGYRLDLRGANLQGADMAAKRSNGSDAVFSGALFNYARMEGANLRATRMEGTDLVGALLVGTDLAEAKLSGARLLWAYLEGAALWDARVEVADLRWTKMAGTALGLANMRNAYLYGSLIYGRHSLESATLKNAALREIDIAILPVSYDQIKTCFGDASVKLPLSMRRPEHWPDWSLEDHGIHAFHTEWRKWQANPDTYLPPPKPE